MSILRSVVSGSVSLALLVAAPLAQAAAQGLDIAAAKVVDLTHPIDASTIFWPTEAKAFELTEEHKGITERGFFSPQIGFARRSMAARISMRRIITVRPPPGSQPSGSTGACALRTL